MAAFFHDTQRREKLQRELESWVGTPYRHMAGVKGSGADCIHFVARVLESLGYRKSFRISPYPRDWHMHNSREMLLDGVLEQVRCEPVCPWRVQDGDLVVYQFGKCASHCGVYCGRRVYHAVNKIGVMTIPFHDRMWRKRLVAVFRVMEQ